MELELQRKCNCLVQVHLLGPSTAERGSFPAFPGGQQGLRLVLALRPAGWWQGGPTEGAGPPRDRQHRGLPGGVCRCA